MRAALKAVYPRTRKFCDFAIYISGTELQTGQVSLKYMELLNKNSMVKLVAFRPLQIVCGDHVMAGLSLPRDHPKHRAGGGRNSRQRRKVPTRFASREDCPEVPSFKNNIPQQKSMGRQRSLSSWEEMPSQSSSFAIPSFPKLAIEWFWHCSSQFSGFSDSCS